MTHALSEITVQSLNLKIALENTQGNIKTLHKILQQVLNNDLTFVEDFCSAIERNEMEEAYRAAHSLKSSLALIGAEYAHPLAVELDAFCKQQLPPLQLVSHAKHLEAPLLQIKTDITTVLPLLAFEEPNFKQEGSLVDLHQQLLQLVASADFASIELVEKLIAISEGVVQKQYRYIASQLADYEFDEAMIWLKKMTLD